jgi:hypothetical protein
MRVLMAVSTAESAISPERFHQVKRQRGAAKARPMIKTQVGIKA